MFDSNSISTICVVEKLNVTIAYYISLSYSKDECSHQDCLWKRNIEVYAIKYQAWFLIH